MQLIKCSQHIRKWCKEVFRNGEMDTPDDHTVWTSSVRMDVSAAQVEKSILENQ
jgi:hypothetical protein